MTLIRAIVEIIDKGATHMTGAMEMIDPEAHWKIRTEPENYRPMTDPFEYLKRAVEIHQSALKYSERPWAQYQLERIDKYFIAEIDGHYIIASECISHFGKRYCSATYSTHATRDEMYEAMQKWQIAKEAEEIADEMETKRPNELPRMAWITIATAELEISYAESKAAFEKEFGGNSTEPGELPATG